MCKFRTYKKLGSGGVFLAMVLSKIWLPVILLQVSAIIYAWVIDLFADAAKYLNDFCKKSASQVGGGAGFVIYLTCFSVIVILEVIKAISTINFSIIAIVANSLGFIGFCGGFKFKTRFEWDFKTNNNVYEEPERKVVENDAIVMDYNYDEILF